VHAIAQLLDLVGKCARIVIKLMSHESARLWLNTLTSHERPCLCTCRHYLSLWQKLMLLQPTYRRCPALQRKATRLGSSQEQSAGSGTFSGLLCLADHSCM